VLAAKEGWNPRRRFVKVVGRVRALLEHSLGGLGRKATIELMARLKRVLNK
jgi:hypothetical protein